MLYTAMDDTLIKIKLIFYLKTIVIFNQKSFKLKYHTQLIETILLDFQLVIKFTYKSLRHSRKW